MPSPANNSTASRQSFWLSIIRILLVEILVLLVLSGAIVAYLNWSSDVAWAEFIAASKQPAPEATTPMQTVKGPKACDRRA